VSAPRGDEEAELAALTSMLGAALAASRSHAPADCASGGRRRRPLSRVSKPYPPPSRTKWTRRVPHRVLIGHASSLTASQSMRSPRGPATPCRGGCASGGARARKTRCGCRLQRPAAGHGGPRLRVIEGGLFALQSHAESAFGFERASARQRAAGSAMQRRRRRRRTSSVRWPPPPPSLPYKVDTSRPSLRTNWTRLVPCTGLAGARASKITVLLRALTQRMSPRSASLVADQMACQLNAPRVLRAVPSPPRQPPLTPLGAKTTPGVLEPNNRAQRFCARQSLSPARRPVPPHPARRAAGI
jgi:hypothetical protein